MPSADFQINLVDKLTGPAKAAQSGVLGLESQLKSAKTALADLSRAQSAAAASSSQEIAQHRAVAAAIQQQKDEVARLQAAYLDQGGTNAARAAAAELTAQEKAATAAAKEAAAEQKKATVAAGAAQKKAATDASALRNALTSVSSTKFTPEMMEVSESTSLVGEMMSMTGVTAAGLVAALAAVAVAAVGVTVAFAQMVLANSDAKRSFLLNMEGFLGSAGAATELDDAIGDLASHVPVAKDRLQSLAKSLAAADLSGQTLKDSLAAIATVEATVGSGGADKLRGFLEKAAAAGGKVALGPKAFAGTGITEADFLGALAKSTNKTMAEVKAAIEAGKISVEQEAAALDTAVKTKLGGVLEKQNLALPAQMQHLKDNIGDLFEGLAKSPQLEGFLGGLKSMLSVFDQNTASGKALTFLITKLGGAMLDVATKAMPVVKHSMLLAALGALRFYNSVIKPLAKADKTSGGGSVTGGISDVLGSILLAVLSPIIIPIALLGQLLGSGGGKGGGGTSSLDASAASTALGTGMTNGTAQGITAGGPVVVAALTGVVGDAIAAAKALLGIASPSKVFAGLGRHTAAGFAAGVDHGAGAAQGSVGRMIAPRGMRGLSQLAGGAGAAAAAGAGGGRGGGGVAVNGTTINVTGVSDPAAAAEMVETAWGDMMERVAMQLPT